MFVWEETESLCQERAVVRADNCLASDTDEHSEDHLQAFYDMGVTRDVPCCCSMLVVETPSVLKFTRFVCSLIVFT